MRKTLQVAGLLSFLFFICIFLLLKSICGDKLLRRGSISTLVDLLHTYSPFSSSAADTAFDAVIGMIEDIIMSMFFFLFNLLNKTARFYVYYGFFLYLWFLDEEFRLLQQNFMEKHYQEFDDSEENKLSYTTIFNDYVSHRRSRNKTGRLITVAVLLVRNLEETPTAIHSY